MGFYSVGQFQNLVFEGGGVKGVAYAGAIEVLERRGDLAAIDRVAGASAGAITAALLALGAGAAEIRDIVAGTQLRAFMDGGWPVGGVLRFARQFGWYRGDAFSAWLRGHIRALAGDPELTLGELAARAHAARPLAPGALQPLAARRCRELYICVTDLSTREGRLLSADTAPGMPVWLAARMSMSIPLFFTAVRHEDRIITDGGVSWNYPIDVFDDPRFAADPDRMPVTLRGGREVPYNKATLGFRVDTSEEIRAQRAREPRAAAPVRTVADFVGMLVSFALESANKAHLRKDDWHRTVFIEANGVRATDFDLPPARVAELIESGRRCTEQYFEWFERTPPGHPQPLNKAA